MDLILDEGWELIPDGGFLESYNDGGNKIYSSGSPNSMIQRNYFMCPQEDFSTQFVDKTVPSSLDHELLKQESVKREFAKIPVEIKMIPPTPQVLEQDPVSQVFFKMENEFVEMKVESPRSSIANELVIKNNYGMEIDMEESDEGGINIWKKGFAGAICSFVMAAATVCVIILGGNKKNKQFEIYTSDKSLKQLISSSRDIPIYKARITVGGRVDSNCYNYA